MKRRLLAALLMLSAPLASPANYAAAEPFTSEPNETPVTTTPETVKSSDLLKPWAGPYGGVPPFKSVRVDEFSAAFDVAIAKAQQDIEAIADNPDPPTFANTLLALETAGEELDRLETVFDVHASNLNVGPIPDIERAVSPKLSAHSDSITQNRKLFARIEAVYSDLTRVTTKDHPLTQRS
ncbi:MAG: hypothetical protein ACF787_04140 [Rhodopirellula sp. JB053]